MENLDIRIRPARPDDGKQIGRMIYDTVRAINRKDYSEPQVEAWAPDPYIFSTYDESYAYVAELKGEIVGFGNFTSEGCLHRFYIHKDFQGQGIGSRLLEALEARALSIGLTEMTTEASITAKAFFLSKGWVIKMQNTKIFREVSFINFKMYKILRYGN